jgi:hypothetical protein
MPNGQQVLDDQLILHYYACDDNAFEQLYKRYRRRLYGFSWAYPVTRAWPTI